MILPVRRKTDGIGYRLAWDNGLMPGDHFVGQGIVSVAELDDVKYRDNKSDRIAGIAAYMAYKTSGVREDEFGCWWETIEQVLVAGLEVVRTLDEYSLFWPFRPL